MILIPFLISMLYCCAFANFLVSILYFCDFATFSHLNIIYFYIIWFCDFDMISWLKHLLNPLRLSPLIRGRWVLMFQWRSLGSCGKPRDAGGAADARQVSIQITSQEQGRWRGRNMDYRRSACLLFSLVQNILGPCWRVGKWLCGLCGWWYRIVKFILFSSALFISYLITRDNARVRGEVSCPHATLTRNFTIQLHKKQALNAQKCNMILAGALSMYRADIWWRCSFSNTLSNPTPAVKPFNLQQGLNPPNCK